MNGPRERPKNKVSAMDKVLIVDNNRESLDRIRQGLQKYMAEFEVLIAPDGEEAIKLLEKEPISVLVTELKMPKVDGLALLAHMTRNYPRVPCIVMTEYEINKGADQKESLYFIEKPFDFNELAGAIIKAVDLLDENKLLKGLSISLSSFLQLIEMEQKTCLLEVNSQGNNKGFFYFNKGILYDAFSGDLKGEKAALEMITWNKAQINFQKLPMKNIRKQIETGLISLLMEASRLKDESSAAEEGVRPGNGSNLKEEGGDQGANGFALPVSDEIGPIDWCDELNEGEAKGREKTEKKPVLRIKEEVKMALEDHLNELKNIKGYKASGVLDYTGEFLAGDSADPNIDPAAVGALLNDVFRAVHEASDKLGFHIDQEAVFSGTEGIVVFFCTGVESKSHVHIITVLEPDGNQALVKMNMEKIGSGIADEIG